MKKSTRTLADIRNDIIRTEGNLEAINRHPFTEEDRAILSPKYSSILKKLKEEESIHNSPVIDPETVQA